MISGLVAIAVFAAILMAPGGGVTIAPVAVAAPTPGQPVDTPFIYTRENAPPARPAAAPSAAATNPGQTGGSAADNNAAPDVSVAPNPFTAGIK